MDFDLEFDEKEREQRMTLNIDGLELDIPEELMEERAELFHFQSKQENIEDLEKSHRIFLICYLENNRNSLDGYNNKFIEYLENELEPFKL